ncbi:9363_t:CDS:2 [Gigaspora rosea]|nr:9363_t:CDS:2 [Gigaspora rosea]
MPPHLGKGSATDEHNVNDTKGKQTSHPDPQDTLYKQTLRKVKEIKTTIWKSRNAELYLQQ